MCMVWRKLLESNNFLHTVHVVPRCRAPKPCPPQQQDTIPYAVKISVLRSWRWAKDCPKHVELILEINKLLLLHLVGFSILLYLHWWCTVKHKSGLKMSKFSNFHKTLLFRRGHTSTTARPFWPPATRRVSPFQNIPLCFYLYHALPPAIQCHLPNTYSLNTCATAIRCI